MPRARRSRLLHAPQIKASTESGIQAYVPKQAAELTKNASISVVVSGGVKTNMEVVLIDAASRKVFAKTDAHGAFRLNDVGRTFPTLLLAKDGDTDSVPQVSVVATAPENEETLKRAKIDPLTSAVAGLPVPDGNALSPTDPNVLKTYATPAAAERALCRLNGVLRPRLAVKGVAVSKFATMPEAAKFATGGINLQDHGTRWLTAM
ncbi:MAG: hypothetical protein JO006_13605 [Paucibacter sp.]|nr:hypothetical protein [Roseateles sp.]